MVKKRIILLGSTGSIGRNVLRVVDEFPDRYEVAGLAAGRDADRLGEQIARYGPEAAALADRNAAVALSSRIDPPLHPGDEGIVELCRAVRCDIVVNAVVGAAGLAPTLASLGRVERICLANKESLVVGGELVMERAERDGTAVLPVDSEHVAIHQCLGAGGVDEVRRLILTASGGPFRDRTADDLESVTVADALHHPTWKMGPKITVDSATMMNKGLEVIEAMHLFRLPADRIDVVVHPQSVVHSMVEFVDRSILAQIGETNMRHPIRYALAWPERLAWSEGFDITRAGDLTFEEPDPIRFPCLSLAREAAAAGGTAPAVLNGANEAAVEAFLAGKIGFPEIPVLIRAVMDRVETTDHPTEEEIFAADSESRRHAGELIALRAGERVRSKRAPAGPAPHGE